jgi:hypothetical protein
MAVLWQRIYGRAPFKAILNSAAINNDSSGVAKQWIRTGSADEGRSYQRTFVVLWKIRVCGRAPFLNSAATLEGDSVALRVPCYRSTNSVAETLEIRHGTDEKESH